MKHFGLMTATAVMVPLAVPLFGLTFWTPDAVPSVLQINSAAITPPDAKSGQNSSAQPVARPISQDLPVFNSDDISVPRPPADTATVSPSSGQPAPTNDLLASGTRRAGADQLAGIRAQALWGQSSGNRAANLSRRTARGEQ